LKKSRDHFKFIYGSLTGSKLTLYGTDLILNIPIFSLKFQKKIKIKEKNSLFEKNTKMNFILMHMAKL
jgi:hypothetical protein